MGTGYLSCWEFRDGRLFSVDEPIEGDADVDANIYKCGYRQEVGSKLDGEVSRATINLYQNHEPSNGKPLFYIEAMGLYQGIGSLIANDFAQLVATLIHISGLLSLFRMDQASAVLDLTTDALAPRP